MQKLDAIPSNRVLANNELAQYLKPSIRANFKNKEDALAAYFREQFSKRYFYDWKNNDERFKEYQSKYDNQKHHSVRAAIHEESFQDNTPWKLPFTYKNSEEQVNAYALRHLARQHKMIDIAMMYHFEGKEGNQIKYFTAQMRSLNAALQAGEYERIKDGNGVYEVFRSGYRVLNWLEIHNLFLGEEDYTDADQLTTIATLLQHGQHLYERNLKFHAGNHQTKGMSSLALLAILFKDFEGTDQWYEIAMARLGEHLEKEINDDGFQFERTVHYHMSDINNYFYVYQLAKINSVPVGEAWESKLNSLFTTLVKIAYPNKTAPVLSDDTDEPWAERNDISGAMTLGYLLFEDPEFGYFAKKKVSSKMYWCIQRKQLELLKNIDTKKPEYSSLVFPDTKYYIMREGYNKGDQMMVISAGLDPDKPDHQHGDMLGVQAMANGKVLLPNYQVRYSLPSYELFKNSMVKNVALVDDQMIGKKYKGNKGGSGFGKFKLLPNPMTIAWKTTASFDLFVGSHNGFESAGVNYTRQVIHVKDEFWIVKDNFESDQMHHYKQVWQGHYTAEGSPNLLRASFEDAVGCDIYQLNKVDSLFSDGMHGKQWNVVSKEASTFTFITVIFPYKGYNKGLQEDGKTGELQGVYSQNDLSFEASGSGLQSLSNKEDAYVFGTSKMSIGKTEISASPAMDCFVKEAGDFIELHSLSPVEIQLKIKGRERRKLLLAPGENIKIRTK